MKTKTLHVYNKIQKYPSKSPETIAWLLYLCLNTVTSVFHEPWFDEAVAWQIARKCSLWDILFYVPHYEGHPPLWHLILLPFAKLGAPYELSLTIVSVLFASTAMALMLRYAPFPRIVKLLLPFTYFLSYQYCVIARPYCIMMLVFMLLAMTYKKRNTNPGKYVACLAFLCATSAYGIVFAGSLAIVWLLEIWNRSNILVFIKSFIRDRRFRWLMGLLLLAIAFILEFIPYADTYRSPAPTPNSFLVRLFYTLIISLAEISCSRALSYVALLKEASLNVYELPAGIMFGLITLVMILYYGKRKKTILLFLIPHAVFGVFAATVYFNAHHVGIILLFLLFWLWVSMESEETVEITLPDWANTYCKPFSVVILGYMMAISLYWNGFACITEVNHTCAFGRGAANFLKEHNLEEYNVMLAWTTWSDGCQDVYNSWHYTILPYLNENIFYNGEFGMDGNYSVNKLPSEEVIVAAFEDWKAVGYPDVIVGRPDLKSVFGEDFDYADYAMVYECDAELIWKSNAGEGYHGIFVRRDLLDEMELTEIPYCPPWMMIY